MKRQRRERSPEPVEMLSADPDLFATGAQVAEQRTVHEPRRPRPQALALGGFALVVVVTIAMWAAWRHGSTSSQRGSATATNAVSIASTPPNTVPGREAPLPSTGAAFALAVEPSPVALGTSVTMRLEGDLSDVSSPLSAVAWIDQRVAGAWRTTHWMARSPGTAQAGGAVSRDPVGPSPDAVTFGADQPVQFSVDDLAPGDYRLCRYVPLRASSTPSVPTSNPAYVCAPLIVDHALPG